MGERLIAVGFRPHVQTVRVNAVVDTDEPAERLLEVATETEARCPVYNLIKASGVSMEAVWVRAAS